MIAPLGYRYIRVRVPVFDYGFENFGYGLDIITGFQDFGFGCGFWFEFWLRF